MPSSTKLPVIALVKSSKDRYQHIGKAPGMLWTVTVGHDRLLAHYHEKHRPENEYVIDPTGLRPKEVR
jgi:hypothetical protein